MFCLKHSFLASLILVLHWLLPIGGHSYTDVDKLMKDLFNGTSYNKDIRPVRNQSHVTQISLGFSLASIDELDLITGEITVTGHATVMWLDEMLHWNSTEYGGISRISLPKGVYWFPKMALEEGTRANTAMWDSVASIALLSNNGFVVWLIGTTYHSKCKVETIRFPFDSHVCTFTFTLLEIDSTEADLVPTSDAIAMDQFTQHGEWTVQSGAARSILHPYDSSDISIASVAYQITLVRRPAFAVIHMLVPIQLMLCLNLLSYFVPVNSGERISYSITLFLALALSSITAVQELPKNSIRITYFSRELLTVNVVVTFGVVWSIVQVRLSGRDEKYYPIPYWLKRLTTVLLRWRKGCCTTNKVDSEGNEGNGKSATETNIPKPPDTGEIGDVDINDKSGHKHSSLHAEVTWISVTEELDFCYFAFSFTCVLILGLVLSISVFSTADV